MKIRYMMLVALLLAILTIGAVNASDDNASSDSLTFSDASSIESSSGDENLQTSLQSDAISNASTTGTFKELNTLIENSKKNSVVQLNVDYVYNNDTDYSFINGIDINKRISIDGQGHTIDGNNLARIFTANENNISIRNINFINLKSNVPDEGVIHNHRERGSFINCNFINCSSNTEGGAITCQYGGTISNCIFKNCFANGSEYKGGGAISIGPECSVSDCRFVNCSANGEGGAIRTIDKSNICNCEFINCTSQTNSAIASYSSGNISNCSFINCYSTTSCTVSIGNDSSILNCKFVNCSDGGAITTADENWIISNCDFIDCSSIGTGGALQLTGEGLVSECRFVNCFSNTGGSAIDAFNFDFIDRFINITDCSFMNCSSENIGGAIWGRGTIGSVCDCIFENCFVTEGGGGAIWCDLLDISGCSFSNCFAQESGAVRGICCNLSDCSFINCSANSEGGAIGWSSNETSVSNCIFVNCSAVDGGAIFCGDIQSNNKIYNCSFTDCSAINGGGAISGQVQGSIISCSFEKCLTENNEFSGGGAICIWGEDNYNVIDCSFANCYSNTGSAITASSNGNIISSSFVNCLSDKNGGAINFAGENNRVTNCSFEKCTSDYGGAIFMTEKNNIISDSQFKNNYVYEDGGAIYSTKEMTVDNCTFYDNSAEYSKGGAIFSSSKSAIKNSTFKGNDAVKGKAIYTDSSDMILTSNKLTHPAGESRNDLVYGVPVDSLKYANEIYNGDRLVIAPKIDIDYTDLTLGEDENVRVSLPNDAPEKITITLSKNGEIIKTAEYVLNNGMASETYAKLGLGVYNITVGYPGDVNYWDTQESVVFMVRPPVDITQNVTVGEDAGISIDLVNATGSVKVIIDGVEYETCPIVNNKLNIDFNTNDLAYGNHNVTFEYIGSGMDKNVFKYWDNETNTYIPFNYDLKLNPAVIDVKEDEFEKSNDEGEVIVELPTDATGTITVFIEGQKELVFDVVKGFAKIDLSSMKDGNYQITYEYSGDKKYSGFTKETNTTLTNNVPEKIIAKDATVTYANKYSVTVKTKTDGGASGVKVNFLINNKLYGSAKTNTNGVASITITKTQATYKITSQVENLSVTKKLKVKHLVTLKTATVKKSAKKLVLTATLGKVNGKYLKNKQVTFKFNGKTYKAKTNSKGVAKYTIKSNVLKKLKVGKKITYQATYQKDTVKKTAKIKK